MSNRPIEPGCLAIIVAAILAENVGKVVSVMAKEGDEWRIRGDIVTVGGKRLEGIAKERQLLRIDDHGEDADDYEVIREEWGITA